GWPAAHASCPRCEWPGRRSSSCEHLGLDAGELGAAESGQIEETTEFVTVEGCAFGRALDLDELSRAGHDHIHIGLGPRILDIGQVEQRLTVDDADADGGDGIDDRVVSGGNEAGRTPLVDGFGQRYIGAGDRGCAGASVGLEDIAVEDQGVLSELLHVDDGAQAATDEAGDLMGAAAELPLDRLTGAA